MKPRCFAPRAHATSGYLAITSLTLFVPASALLISAPAAAERKNSSVPIAFNIPDTSLETALLVFAVQSGVQVVMQAEDVRGLTAHPLKEVLPPREALRLLLGDTPLKFQWISPKLVSISRSESARISHPMEGRPKAMPRPRSRRLPAEANFNVDAEIVVTAQRRTERLQDVPVSVAVVKGETMVRQNVATLEGVSNRSSSLVIRPAPGGDQIAIRGTGSGFNPGFEQSVATFVDGIYRPRARSIYTALFDLERLEVLKGPQTTFFGANAIAGVRAAVQN